MADNILRWRIDDLKKERSSLNDVKAVVGVMNQKLSHRGMLPINSLCSVEGTIIDTNTVLIKLGDFVVSRSTTDAQRLIDEKIEVIDTILAQLDQKPKWAAKSKEPSKIPEEVVEEEEEPFNIEENWTPEESQLNAAEK